MNTKCTLLVLLVAALLAFVTPTFALDVNKLSSAMNQYAAVSEWMNMIMHPGMPKPWTNPMLPLKMKEMSAAQDTIRKEIATIDTKEDLAKARAVAETFKMCDGVWRDVGHQIEMMLNEREKFLQSHS